MKIKAIMLGLLCIFMSIPIFAYKDPGRNYLAKPSGQYRVGFEETSWVDRNICSNDKHDEACHKITVRIYYPTNSKAQARSSYNSAYINEKEQEILNKIPNVSIKQITQLNQIKSYAIKHASIIKNDKFPVLIFSPGGGCSAELYENLIIQLVSHGYIIIGINTQFNGETKNDSDIEKKSIPFDIQVLNDVYEKIHSLHHSNDIFRAMDLDKIGLFGHSIGGRVIADFTHAHPAWIKAAVTLDIGFDTSGASKKKFAIPFMHQMASATQSEKTIPVSFELGKNNYLVVLASSDKNHNYSRHMNFTDLSTLQYLPVFQKYWDFLKKEASKEFDIKFMEHSPTDEEINHYIKPTYVLINHENKWDIEFYKTETDKTHFKRGPYHFIGGINGIKGLPEKLKTISLKNIESLSNADIKPIKIVLTNFQHESLENPLGTGNGWKITSTINTYLLEFFNTFLKDGKNTSFKKCTPLNKNSYIRCGEGSS